MALLAARVGAAFVVATATVAGCYQPDLRDCTVTCAGPGECAHGQVCGDDGYCASADVAGSCATHGLPDAHRAADARPAPDARLAPDAMQVAASLHVTIKARGEVVVAPVGVTCEAVDDKGASCMYDVFVGEAVTLTEMTTHGGDTFMGWMHPGCTGTVTTCPVSCAPGTTTVGATFKAGGG